MNTNIVSASILALGLALSGFFISQGIIKFKTLNRVVEVRGLDEQIVDSTEASWNMTFVVQGNQLAEVYKNANENEKIVRSYLTMLGFKDEEIATGALSTQDQYQNSYSQIKPAFRYTGRMNISVSSKNVDLIVKAQTSSSSLVAKEIQIESNNIIYRYTDLNSIKPEMVKNANKSARDAAMSFAKDTGAEVGEIERASQGLFSISSVSGMDVEEYSRKKKVRVVTQVSFYLN